MARAAKKAKLSASNYIAVDWGTTRFRAYLLQEDGGVVDEISVSGGGLLSLSSSAEFDAALEKHLNGDQGLWKIEYPVYICGMAGSRNGWVEVPYVATPATPEAIASGVKTMQSKKGRTVHMIPGCCCSKAGYTAPDVMRGEEVQLMGAFSIQQANNEIFCLPGTHSKWAKMDRDGTIRSFSSHMTGEVFAHLMEHSILGASTRKLSTSDTGAYAADTDMAAFTMGLQLAKQQMKHGGGDGLLSHLFTARTNELAGVLRPAQVKSYLSGLLIGHELAAACGASSTSLSDAVTGVSIIGSSALAQLYDHALRQFGFVPTLIDSAQVVQAGIRAVRAAQTGRAAAAVAAGAGNGNGNGTAATGLAGASGVSARFSGALEACPLVAILRGLTPDESVAIGEALVQEGITLIEVPLNSPEPYKSVAALSAALKGRAIVGAGTVLTKDQVEEVVKAGGELIVSPNCDSEVIAHAKALGCAAVPGVCTPTEGFKALRAGADGLKLFPSSLVPPAALKAMLAVLPKGVKVLPVGGVDTRNMETYWKHGANGFGIGSALYKPGVTANQIKARAAQFLEVVKRLPPK